VRTALIILFSLLPAVCIAQEAPPRFEFFAGYSLYNAAARERHNFSGAQVNIKYNARPWVALAVDAGGQYRSDPSFVPPSGLSFFNLHDRYLHAYQFLLGPEMSRRGASSDVFLHVMPGIVHGIPDRTGGNFAAVGLGGGAVFHQQKKVGLRFQADYILNRGGGTTYHDFRLGIGAVLRVN
jgi:hypothetical protein